LDELTGQVGAGRAGLKLAYGRSQQTGFAGLGQFGWGGRRAARAQAARAG